MAGIRRLRSSVESSARGRGSLDRAVPPQSRTSGSPARSALAAGTWRPPSASVRRTGSLRRVRAPADPTRDHRVPLGIIGRRQSLRGCRGDVNGRPGLSIYQPVVASAKKAAPGRRIRPGAALLNDSGDNRLSRRSTIMGLAGLTAVFGMGTGVTPPVWSPEKSPGRRSSRAGRQFGWVGHTRTRAISPLTDPNLTRSLSDRRAARCLGAQRADRGGQAARLLGPVG